MRLSFDDEESFKGAIESLRFNNSPGDPNSQPKIGRSNSMPLEDSERNEDLDNITTPSDPITLRRMGSWSTSSHGLSIQETWGSGDIQICFNNPPSNPEFTGTSANGT